MGSGDWTHEFFSGPWLAVQRLARTPEQSAKEAEFIARTIERSPGDEVPERRLLLASAAYSRRAVDS